MIGRGSTLGPKVSDLLRETAEAEGIDFTLEASGRSTGTDADSIQIARGGIAAGLVSIPLRYMHSTVEMVSLADVEGTIRLIVAFIRRLDPEESFAVQLEAQWASSAACAGGRDSSASEVISSGPRAASSRTSVASFGERA